jgi:LemA protein
LALQEELSSTENRIGFARQAYNDMVMRYNTLTETIPTNLVAGIGGFQKAEFFEIQTATEREAPKVQF